MSMMARIVGTPEGAFCELGGGGEKVVVEFGLDPQPGVVFHFFVGGVQEIGEGFGGGVVVEHYLKGGQEVRVNCDGAI